MRQSWETFHLFSANLELLLCDSCAIINEKGMFTVIWRRHASLKQCSVSLVSWLHASLKQCVVSCWRFVLYFRHFQYVGIFYNKAKLFRFSDAKLFNSRCKFIPGVEVNDNFLFFCSLDQISRTNRQLSRIWCFLCDLSFWSFME